MDRKFDAKDYQQNPGKYRLFSTAQIATHVFTQDGANDLPEGKHVAIAFRCEAPNPLYRRVEPVYHVTGDGIEPRDLYANALKNFVL